MPIAENCLAVDAAPDDGDEGDDDDDEDNDDHDDDDDFGYGDE